MIENFSNLLEKAIVQNDADEIGRFLADDWVIIDSDGNIVEKAQYLGEVRSGVLVHEIMESEDVRVRPYGDTAVVTGLTRSRGKFMGQEFISQERATDVFVKSNERWSCVLSQLTRYTK